jgi:hypothetical protein
VGTLMGEGLTFETLLGGDVLFTVTGLASGFWICVTRESTISASKQSKILR